MLRAITVTMRRMTTIVPPRRRPRRRIRRSHRKKSLVTKGRTLARSPRTSPRTTSCTDLEVRAFHWGTALSCVGETLSQPSLSPLRKRDPSWGGLGGHTGGHSWAPFLPLDVFPSCLCLPHAVFGPVCAFVGAFLVSGHCFSPSPSVQ